ncbi:AMP-binding protein [Nocardia sp. ET3-3]|uniref:AMP-binding protein n=1 Tax=Nocardia terrae TaxID=2675851 RepID=A0A7K1UT88_9NOCA|nr:AMP-binding protein [Nocardia terrae]MVU77560.1 AMP-binding protein [Nocardia terrae]
MDPQVYPRIFAGIGACEQVEAGDGHPVWQFRIGTPRAGLRTLTVTMRLGRGEDFEVQCPQLGSFGLIRFRGDADRTRVTVTYFAPGRVHPAIAGLSISAVTDWTVRALHRLADLVSGTAASVVDNGENSPLRSRLRVAQRIVSTGVVAAARPDRSVRQLGEVAKWGFNLAGGYAAGAAHSPDRVAVHDRHGDRTYHEIHTRSQRLAGAMAGLGLHAGDAVGLLALNHAGAVETMVAAGKLGIDVVLLNAGLSARRIEDIVQRHRLECLFVDSSLEPLVHYLHSDIRRIRTDRGTIPGRTGIDDLIEADEAGFPQPTRHGRLIVLTSGTSGTPKGARRPHAKGFATIAALLSRIPLRVNETMLIAAPLFHTWGLAALQLSTALRDSVVLAEEFDAADCLRRIAELRAAVLIVVPTMVQRLLDLPDHIRDRYDTSSLRVVVSCGAPLAGATVLRFMDAFGDILYNVYGSTEVSWATIATPDDLRISPTTAGRPPLGTKLAVLGPDRRPVPIGATGRIYVGNHMLFDGYVNCPPPDEVDGLLDTGDLGYLDAAGRLFIAGRDDEMIISGGENVFPRPVEEALSHLPQISEVAVVGVPDREFGQRLVAFIVEREGSGLDPDMVRGYIRNRLSRFSVPRDIVFLTALPRGETGKVLKWLLTGTTQGSTP